jgi:hypothetical protein
LLSTEPFQETPIMSALHRFLTRHWDSMAFRAGRALDARQLARLQAMRQQQPASAAAIAAHLFRLQRQSLGMPGSAKALARCVRAAAAAMPMNSSRVDA